MSVLEKRPLQVNAKPKLGLYAKEADFLSQEIPLPATCKLCMLFLCIDLLFVVFQQSLLRR